MTYGSYLISHLPAADRGAEGISEITIDLGLNVMNFDIVSSIVSTFTLAQILHGCAIASNDIDHFADMLNDTAKLHSDVSLDFEKLAVRLSSKRKNRLAADIKRAGVVLESAKTAMGGSVVKVTRKRSR